MLSSINHHTIVMDRNDDTNGSLQRLIGDCLCANEYAVNAFVIRFDSY